MSEFSCSDCPRHATRGRNYVKGKGNPKAQIVIVGSGPSDRDEALGAPFMGDAGRVLERALGEAGLRWPDVFMAHLVRCYGGKPSGPEIQACAKHLDREISYVKPRVLVLLGDLPILSVLGKEPTASTKALIWDSGECARAFTFARGDASHTDEATGEVFYRPARGAFKVVAGPDPRDVIGNGVQGAALARALTMAAKLAAGSSVVTNLNYSYAHDEDSAFRMLTKLRERASEESILSYDLETSGLTGYPRMCDPYKADILTGSFCFRPAEAFAVAIRPRQRTPRVVQALKGLLEHPIAKLGHAGAFDNVMARQDMGVQVTNYAFDTFVGAYALDQDSNAKGLDDLAPALRPDLGRWWEKVAKYLDPITGYLNCPDDLLLEYNAKDSDATLSVWEDMLPRLVAQGRHPLFTQILMPHYREICEMKYFGVRLDVDGAKAVGRSMLAKVKAEELACLAKIGRHPHWWGPKDLAANGVAKADFRPFNVSSGPQLAELIYNELKVPVLVRTEKEGAPSTSLDALEALKKEHPFISDLLAYRKDQKFMSSFIGWEEKEVPPDDGNLDLFGERPKPETEGIKADGRGMLACVGTDGRLRPEIHIDGAETGRVSITEPALQTIPKTKEMRSLLIPDPGYVFIDADYKALELRIIAMLSGDPEFLRIFREGLDPHSITASRMFGLPLELPPTKAERDAYFEVWNKKYADQRKKAKAVNFGIPYGEGAQGLADQLGVSEKEAQSWLDAWSGKTFPVAARWLEKTVRESRKAGGVNYSLGRFRRLPGFLSAKQAEQSRAERQAKNTPIQGTGGDCTSVAIARIHDRLRREFGAGWSEIARIVLEVHDQIVTECLRERAKLVMGWVVDEMSRQMPFLPNTLVLEVDAAIKERWDV
jgi:DNA polymerase I